MTSVAILGGLRSVDDVDDTVANSASFDSFEMSTDVSFEERKSVCN